MKEKQTIKVNATVIEKLFVTGILLLIIILFVNYSVVSSFLKSQASEVDHARIDLKISEESVSQTKKMESFLSTHEDLIKRTDRASGKPVNNRSPQEQALNDLQAYAKLINVQITGYDFQDVAASSSSTSSPSSPPPSSSSSSTTQGSTSTAPAAGSTSGGTAAGVKSFDVTLTLSSKVNYSQYLAFITLLQEGASRMELKDVTISSPKNNSAADNGTTTLSIKVYTR